MLAIVTLFIAYEGVVPKGVRDRREAGGAVVGNRVSEDYGAEVVQEALAGRLWVNGLTKGVLLAVAMKQRGLFVGRKWARAEGGPPQV